MDLIKSSMESRVLELLGKMDIVPPFLTCTVMPWQYRNEDEVTDSELEELMEHLTEAQVTRSGESWESLFPPLDENEREPENHGDRV